MDFSIIVAIDNKRSIGYHNQIQWNIPADMKLFKDITTKPKSAIIMGRNTFLSIGKALPHRLNIVLSRNEQLRLESNTNIKILDDFDKALDYCLKIGIQHCFVIGGGKLYDETIHHMNCKSIYVTEIKQEFKGDVFFPMIPTDTYILQWSSKMLKHNNIDYQFTKYERK